jgi:hypothetical protein
MVSSVVGQPTAINDKVVEFCNDHLGEKVGEGECSNLAEAALQHAGAKPWTTFKESPGAGDYVWGKFVYALAMEAGSPKETKIPEMSMQPGDVIQFRDARFTGKNLRGFKEYEVNSPHHTAVILDVKKAAGVITVFEQNIDGKKIVAKSAYRLTDLRTGWFRVYRPEEK